ncbi:hypothetical protein KK083_21390 [Fulvivirgaceae bacterium PWU4]|uniref:Uncharacterized protein n=1 Tax=Chryseosolibacter histidini TaxID=2782349 RepID=A0AAP2DN76_9BACT|nr:hypothetical protein [Chryseosolibacter histidini]MBT1699466.1 hypothetical protein [Chryseosolibacter histidini]
MKMTAERIKQFEKVSGQLEAFHSEIGALSQKFQNDALNKFKLSLVNQVLIEANAILGDTYRPFPGFQSFDADQLPSNSDVVLVIAQYIQCMENLRVENIQSKVEYSAAGKIDKTYWYWKGTEKETFSPKKIK